MIVRLTKRARISIGVVLTLLAANAWESSWFTIAFEKLTLVLSSSERR